MPTLGLTIIHEPLKPKPGNGELGADRTARRGRQWPASEAIARWLLHAVAESARAWALAAGVPPGLSGDCMMYLVEGRANPEDQ